MARTEIPVTTLSRSGATPPAQTDSDQTHGMVVKKNDGRIYVEIVSTDAGSQTIGFAIPGLVDDEAVDDKLVTVPAGATRIAGPWPRRTYNQPQDADDPGGLYINPSVNTTLKLRAFKLPAT